MNSKKIMAGLLSAAMVVTSFAVPASAAEPTEAQKNYQIKTKLASDGTTASGTLKDVSLGTWWTPETFSDSLKITDKLLTITYDVSVVDPSAGDPWASYLLFYSKSGAAYGSQPGDLSYYAANGQDMTEYMTVYNNFYAYNLNGANSWSEGKLVSDALRADANDLTTVDATYVPWGVDGDGNVIHDCAEDSEWQDDWEKNGAKSTITAILDGDYAVLHWEFVTNKSGWKTVSDAKVKYDKKKGILICLNGNPQKADNEKFTNIKFNYKSVKKTHVEVNGKVEASATYNTAKQAPNVVVKDETGAVVTDKYDISVVYNNKTTTTLANAAFVNAGTYQISATVKKAYADDYLANAVAGKYTINKASQTIKLGTKKANKKKITVTYKASKLKKKKATFTVKLTGTKATNLAAKKQYTITTNKVSGKVGSKKLKITAKMSKKNTIKVTIPKKMPKGTYKFTVQAQQNDNYAQSKFGANTVTIKIK